MANAAKRAGVRELEKRDQQLGSIRASVVIGLMGHHDGRQYVQDVLEQSHVFQTSFSENYGEMCFREGERNFGLRLLADVMQNCPEQFIQMMREENARREYDDERTRRDIAAASGDDDSDDSPDPGADVYGAGR